jgi:hypothetical protein
MTPYDFAFVWGDRVIPSNKEVLREYSGNFREMLDCITFTKKTFVSPDGDEFVAECMEAGQFQGECSRREFRTAVRFLHDVDGTREFTCDDLRSIVKPLELLDCMENEDVWARYVLCVAFCIAVLCVAVPAGLS